MKFITKIIPIMGLIAITLVLIVFIDIKDTKKYNEINSYQKKCLMSNIVKIKIVLLIISAL